MAVLSVTIVKVAIVRVRPQWVWPFLEVVQLFQQSLSLLLDGNRPCDPLLPAHGAGGCAGTARGGAAARGAAKNLGGQSPGPCKNKGVIDFADLAESMGAMQL